jgi:heptaprenylglyceryl phosphate synthase
MCAIILTNPTVTKKDDGIEIMENKIKHQLPINLFRQSSLYFLNKTAIFFSLYLLDSKMLSIIIKHAIKHASTASKCVLEITPEHNTINHIHHIKCNQLINRMAEYLP